jgi:acetylornithine deacetylase/succinyl-diaminopimelate desuccinylase-like protein
MHKALKYSLLIILSLNLNYISFSQKISISNAEKHKYLNEFMEFLSIPNVVTDTLGINQNAKFIGKMLENRGIIPKYLDGYTNGMPPVIFGEVNVGATKTIVFYAHYDGQPANPNNWAEGLKHYNPKL